MTAPEPRDSATHPTTPTPTRSAVLGAVEGQETAAGDASTSGRVQPDDGGWSDAAVIAEQDRRERYWQRGDCPDSGLEVHECHKSVCDCFGSADCRTCSLTTSASTQPRGAK